MEPTTPLEDTLYREEVLRARAMAPADRLVEGFRLFERACRVMADGVRHQHPDLDEAAVTAFVRARLDRIRAIERS